MVGSAVRHKVLTDKVQWGGTVGWDRSAAGGSVRWLLPSSTHIEL